jgi:hypothetical protein
VHLFISYQSESEMEGQDSIGNTDQQPPGLRLRAWNGAANQIPTEPQQRRGVASNTATVHPTKSKEDAEPTMSPAALHPPILMKLEEKTTPGKVGQSKLNDRLPPNHKCSISKSNSFHTQGVRVWNKKIQFEIDQDKALLLTTVSSSCKETNSDVSCSISPIERNVLSSNSKSSPEPRATWFTNKHGAWQKGQVPVFTRKESTLTSPLVLPKANVSTFVSSDICTFTKPGKSYASIVDGSAMKVDQLSVEKVVKPRSYQKLNGDRPVATLLVNSACIGNQESMDLLNHFIFEVRGLANHSMEGLTDNQQKVFRIAVQDLVNVIRQMQLTNCEPRAPVGKQVACPTCPKPNTLAEEFPKAMVDKEQEVVILRLPKPLTSYSDTTVSSITVDSDEFKAIEIIPPPSNPEQDNLTMEVIPRNQIISEMESVGWTDEELVNLIN